jgi:hypothetical protein
LLGGAEMRAHDGRENLRFAGKYQSLNQLCTSICRRDLPR